jgi:hypothetical protein
MEMRHSNTRLSVYVIGDASTFIAKRIGAPVIRVSLCMRNRRHAILMGVSFLSQKQSRILNKLRRVTKQRLPSNEPGVHLCDVGGSHFSDWRRSPLNASPIYLLCEFQYSRRRWGGKSHYTL